ncbi:MAG: hypothetical protein ABEJ65_11790 [bacterium]
MERKTRKRHFWILTLFIALLIVLSGNLSHAMVARGNEPSRIPVKELIKTFQSTLRDQPNNAIAHYRLGRTHYFAYYLKSREIYGFRPDTTSQDTLPRIANFRSSINRNRIWEFNDRKPIPDSSALNHLINGIKHHQRAIKIKNKPLFHLGFASILQQGRQDANSIRKHVSLNLPTSVQSELLRGDTSLRKRWLGLATYHYWKAFKGAVIKDLERITIPDDISNTVSHEAGKNFQQALELIDRDREHSALQTMDTWYMGWAGRLLGVGDRWDRRYVEVDHKLRDMREKVQGTVTPLILSLKPVDSWEQLIDSNVRVKFDMTGNGRPHRWKWVKPGTGFLVWTPGDNPTISSGKQLFGSVTWWMFWKHGYQPLAVLDQNNDGWLREKELLSLSLWFDRNQDGDSQPEEIVSVTKSGIVAIAVHPTAEKERVLKSDPGIVLKNGQTLPTWDWKVAPE